MGSRTFALRVAPQRNTQYARLAGALAAPELLASPLGERLEELTRRALAGEEYLVAYLDGVLAASDRFTLGLLGAVSECHELYDELGGVRGPLLRPVELPRTEFVPFDMAVARRYRGKTNELFTTVLLNVALFVSDFAGQQDQRLRVLDPVAGGGTTLFTALRRGYDAVGIEREREDVETTTAFVRQFLREQGIPFAHVDEHLRGRGRRNLFQVGRAGQTRLLCLALGDTTKAADLLEGLPGGAKFHALVADLPYGVRHSGQVRDLIRDALPIWETALLPGAGVALAWDATRVNRDSLWQLASKHTTLTLVDRPPFNQFVHAVDRQIKRRDVLVLRKESAAIEEPVAASGPT